MLKKWTGMTLLSHILECHMTSFSYEIYIYIYIYIYKGEGRKRTAEEDKRIFALCFSKKVG